MEEPQGRQGEAGAGDLAGFLGMTDRQQHSRWGLNWKIDNFLSSMVLSETD